MSGTRSSRRSDDDLLYVALPIGSVDGIQGAVRVTYPASVIDEQIQHIWLLLAATGGVVLGIVFLASLLLARSVTKPLDDLERRRGAARCAVTSRARAEVPEGPGRAARCSRESFNATAARLEQLVGSQRGVRRRRVAPAAHAAGRAAAPAREPRGRRARRRRRGPRGRARRGRAALPSRRRAARARARRAVARRHPRRSRSTPVIDGRVRRVGRVRGRAARAHRRRRSTGSPAARATPGRLEQVVDNLLNNALEVAPEGSAVRPRRGRARRLGRAARQRRGPGHDGRGARPRVRPLLAVGRARAATGGRTATSGSGWRSCASWSSATAATSRSSRRPPVASRSWCGCGAATARATRASVSSRPPPRPEPRSRSTRRGGRCGCASTSSASVKRSRIWRVSSDTPTHTSCRTQWPSQWSCSPSSVVSGPSTAARMSASVISVGRAGEHVATAHAALRAHEPGALHREQDLLEVRLGEAGALGDLLHRRRALGAVQREREERARRRSRPGSTPSRRPSLPLGKCPRPCRHCRAWGRRRPGYLAAPSLALVEPVKPDYAGPNVTGVVPALLGVRPVAWLPAPVAGAPVHGAAGARRPRLGGAASGIPDRLPELRALLRRADHHRRAVDHRRPRSRRSPPGSRRRGTASSGSASASTAACSTPSAGSSPTAGGRPTRRTCSGTRRSAAARSRWSPRRVPHAPGSPARTCAAPTSTAGRPPSVLVEHVPRARRRRRAVRLRVLPGRRRGRARVRARRRRSTRPSSRAADRLVGDLLDALPDDVALVVTADHGQVHVGPDGWLALGAARTSWSRPTPATAASATCTRGTGAAAELLAAAEELHGDARVGVLARAAARRGLARARPGAARSAGASATSCSPRTGPSGSSTRRCRTRRNLLGAHGSLTAAEMQVPLVAGRGRAGCTDEPRLRSTNYTGVIHPQPVDGLWTGLGSGPRRSARWPSRSSTSTCTPSTRCSTARRGSPTWWRRPPPTASPRSASPTTGTCTASSTSTAPRATPASRRSSAPRPTWSPRQPARPARGATEHDIYHLTLLAESTQGYSNLIKVVVGRVPRRLLLEAARRLRAARAAPRGARRHHRLPRRRGVAGAARRRLRARAASTSSASSRSSGATRSSSSCRTTACPSSSRSTRS